MLGYTSISFVVFIILHFAKPLCGLYSCPLERGKSDAEPPAQSKSFTPKRNKVGSTSTASDSVTPVYEEVDIFAGVKPTVEVRARRKRKSTAAATTLPAQTSTGMPSYLSSCCFYCYYGNGVVYMFMNVIGNFGIGRQTNVNFLEMACNIFFSMVFSHEGAYSN